MAAKKDMRPESKVQRYIVVPRSTEAVKEMFCTANGKRIPFDKPVVLSENDVKVLKNQKEPIKIQGEINVQTIMDEFKVPQRQANEIAKARERDGNGTRVKWVPRYSVVPV